MVDKLEKIMIESSFFHGSSLISNVRTDIACDGDKDAMESIIVGTDLTKRDAINTAQR